MIKARVVIKTVTKHQIYVEQDGERFLYALTSDLDEAKEARTAGQAFGIGSRENQEMTPMRQRGKIRASQATAQ
jgi:hypothetical protein